MIENQNLIQEIRQKRQAFHSSDKYKLRKKVKQIQMEMVKLSFESNPDMRLYAIFLVLLKKTKNQLSDI